MPEWAGLAAEATCGSSLYKEGCLDKKSDEGRGAKWRLVGIGLLGVLLGVLVAQCSSAKAPPGGESTQGASAEAEQPSS